MPTVNEIASTSTRLLSHTDRLSDIVRTGRIDPVTVHLSPTDKCNLNCHFCSVKDRSGNELDLDQCKGVIDGYGGLGVGRKAAKSIEITGGGDPLCHPDIESIVEHVCHRGLDVGLISNGIALDQINNLRDFTFQLKWMRLSLNGIDFDMDSTYLDIDPESLRTFVGCSYVFTHEVSTEEHLQRVSKIAEHLGAEYIRVVPNCYTEEDIEWTKKHVPELIRPYPKMFLQLKDHLTPPVCYWRYIKPFVNSDGWIYHCSTCALFEGRFPKRWRVARWDAIEEVYNGNTVSFDTSDCPLCFYSGQNMLLDGLLSARRVTHRGFV